MRVTYSLLFLCTGNIGRSPLAAALAQHKLAEALGLADSDLERRGIRVWSAGTLAPEGMPPAPKSVAVAKERGVDLRGHISTRLTRGMADGADRVYCMDATQIEYLRSMGASIRAELLSPDGTEIPDPRGRDLEFYEEVCGLIDSALDQQLPVLLAELDLAGR